MVQVEFSRSAHGLGMVTLDVIPDLDGILQDSFERTTPVRSSREEKHHLRFSPVPENLSKSYTFENGQEHCHSGILDSADRQSRELPKCPADANRAITSGRIRTLHRTSHTVSLRLFQGFRNTTVKVFGAVRFR